MELNSTNYVYLKDFGSDILSHFRLDCVMYCSRCIAKFGLFSNQEIRPAGLWLGAACEGAAPISYFLRAIFWIFWAPRLGPS